MHIFKTISQLIPLDKYRVAGQVIVHALLSCELYAWIRTGMSSVYNVCRCVCLLGCKLQGKGMARRIRARWFFWWKWILESRIVRSKLSEFVNWTVLYSCSDTLLCSPFSRPVWTREPCTISPPRFVTRCCKRPLNHGTTGVQNVCTSTPFITGYADVIYQFSWWSTPIKMHLSQC